MTFYENTVKKCLEKGLLSTDDNILVVGGGQTDKNTFLNLGFKKVVISNLGLDRGFNDFAPYTWNKQDTEALTYDENHFDWVFTNAVLHHCSSPHKALCEMLRVAKKGIGVFESRDSFLIKTGLRVGLTSAYELEPSILTNGKLGGYRDTCVPNYIYRWTEREVMKTVSSYLPHYIHSYHFFYGLSLPTQRLAMSTSFIKRLAGKLGSIFLPLFRLLFKKQCNNFAFVVSKKGKLQPWLNYNDEQYSFNMDYIKGRYAPENYKV